MRYKHILRIRYSLLFSIGGLIMAVGVIQAIRTISIMREKAHSQACFTRQQVSSDTRCLYVLNNTVYEKDTRAKSHKGHPCGTDVTSIIPSFHTSDVAKYLTPNYRGSICSQPTPTSIPPSPTSSPTLRPLPSATVVPGATTLTVTVSLHGIGSTGDNANVVSSRNIIPLNSQRTIHVQLLNINNVIVYENDIIATYTSANSLFTGTLAFPPTIPSGSYNIKVGAKLYLKKYIPGIQTITQGTTVQLPVVSLVVGDVTGDNQLTVLDYNLLVGCFSDLHPATLCDGTKAATTDLNDDGKVNQYDYNLFLREIRFVQNGD